MKDLEELTKLEIHMYHIYEQMKQKPSENLETLLEEFLQKEKEILESFSVKECIELYDYMIEKENLPQNFIFLHTVIESKKNPVLLRIYYKLFKRIQFLSLQEYSTIEYRTMEKIMGNPYFAKLMKKGNTFVAFENLLCHEFQKLQEVEDFYLLGEEKNLKIEDMNFLMILLNQEIYNVTLDYLISEDKKVWENYLDAILNVVPAKYHLNLLLQIQNSYFVLKKENSFTIGSILKLNHYLKTKSKDLSLYQEIENEDVEDIDDLQEPKMEEDIDMDVITASEEELMDFEIAYERLMGTSRKLFSVLERKIENPKDKVILAEYYALKKEEEDILSSISDIDEFENYLNLCYEEEDEDVYPIPFKIVQYTKALMNQNDTDYYPVIEDFFRIRVFYLLYHYTLALQKEEEETGEEITFEEGAEILNELMENVQFLLDCLFNSHYKNSDDYKELQEYYDYAKELMEEQELKGVFTGVIQIFLFKLQSFIKSSKNKKQKQFFQKCYFYLIFLEGGLLDVLMEHDEIEIRNVHVPMKEEYYESYKEFMLEDLKNLTYHNEEEKLALKIYEDCILETLKDEDILVLKRKKHS